MKKCLYFLLLMLVVTSCSEKQIDS
ncbi:lipoprotein, partial [Phocaeicola sp.]